jgi:hypothetical protein
MVSRFEPNPDLDAVVAAKFARPLVEHATLAVRDAARGFAPPVKIWLTVQDERVRRSHVKTDGQAVPDNLRFKLPKVRGAGIDLARLPRDLNLPLDNRINCFPPETRAYPLGELLRSIEAPYVGDMVTVTVASGRVLTGTPNHPVLTLRGWIALGMLDNTDQLVRHLGRQDNVVIRAVLRALSAAAPQIDHRPPTLRQIQRALGKAGDTQRIRRAAVNFHGDRPAGDVDVVRADRVLHHWLLARLAKYRGDTALPHADVLPGLLANPGFRRLLSRRGDAAPTSHVRGRREPSPLVGAGARHADTHRGATPSSLDASRFQTESHSAAVDAECLGQRQFGFASAIALDQVVQIEVNSYVGHVHTLNTSTDSFVANGFIVHNCRCEAIPVPDMLSRSIHSLPPVLQGTRVVGVIQTYFKRAAESENGTSEDTPAHFFLNALRQVAASMRNVRTRR